MRAIWCSLVLAAALAGADGNLLTNPALTLADGAIAGWRGGEATMSSATTGLPDGVASAITVPISGSGPDGQVLQRLAIGDKGARWQAGAWAKATAAHAAYVQVKLFDKDHKELKRISLGEAGTEWKRIESVVDATGAIEIELLLRWHRGDKTAGATAWFAAPSLAPAVEGAEVPAKPAEAKPAQVETAAPAAVQPVVLKAGVPTVVLVGDSTVQDYPATDVRRGWGQVLGGYLAPGVAVVNRAVGGRSTKTFREEGRWEPILAAKPALVLIQFGHNDSHAPGNPESTDAKTDFRSNLARYIAEAKAAGIPVVLVTPPPRRLFRDDGGISRELAPYVEAMREVAATAGVPCIDLYTGGVARLKELGNDGSMPLYCSEKDRSHFSERGAQTMARIVAGGLLALDEPLRKLVRDQAKWPAVKDGP